MSSLPVSLVALLHVLYMSGRVQFTRGQSVLAWSDNSQAQSLTLVLLVRCGGPFKTNPIVTCRVPFLSSRDSPGVIRALPHVFRQRP